MNRITKLTISLIMAMTAILPSAASEQSKNTDTTQLVVLFTTDVHGNFFDYNFINGTETDGGLIRIATFIDSLRDAKGQDNVILLDNGDILQGQPTVYYYNFIDTTSNHIVDDIYQFMKYDAATIGNHDIETGHAVYDRWINRSPIPILGANVIDTTTQQPYLQPYQIIERNGVKIAIIGLLTPAIPAWLPERLWSNLRFEPMIETASKWVGIVREKENPDLIIGLFHSGKDSSKTTAGYIENASIEVARNVEGFDAVFFGHDHQLYCDSIVSPGGRQVYLINPANNAQNIGMLTVNRNSDGSIYLQPSTPDCSTLPPSKLFRDRFSKQFNDVKKYVERQIGTVNEEISTRDAYFGPSSFMTLLHRLQLEISGADISMAAPLTFDGLIHKGPLTVSDMFTLYKYENTLCTLNMSGREVKDYLEFSYSLWSPEYDPSDPHIIRYASTSPTPEDNRLKNPSYNFDSAAGINYTVNLSAPTGQRITITSMSDGTPFDLDKTYTVAINSYRAGGGGNHLTEGAGISPDELKKRIISSTDKDLRYYLTNIIDQKKVIEAQTDHNWHFLPTDYVKQAEITDRNLLFGPNSNHNQK